MTNKDIKDKIENDFGWLTPDEKQKLNSLLISVWNDAVVASAQVVDNEENITNLYYSDPDAIKHEFKESVSEYFITPINALKLKL